MSALSSRSPILLAIACASFSAICLSQQPGPNVNVLPSYGLPGSTDPLLGDGYLQRQVEPAIAASSFNPDHIFTAFIDYRTVSIAGDVTMPGDPNLGTAGEAWIGCSRSYDRGRTWFGCMVPGFPQDTSAVGQQSPLYGLTAAGDPVLAPGVTQSSPRSPIPPARTEPPW